MNLKSAIEKINKSIFCYAKKNGQGLVDKKECKCSCLDENNGNRIFICQAYKEREDFYSMYDKMSEQGYCRREIIEAVKNKYKWEETQWIQFNVKP
ncbi:hypothetical protein QO179_23860 [Bacillus stercoris]|nr:hypothetical protein [Bacillus stercoris]